MGMLCAHALQRIPGIYYAHKTLSKRERETDVKLWLGSEDAKDSLYKILNFRYFIEKITILI
jgi:hypothetical protein